MTEPATETDLQRLEREVTDIRDELRRLQSERRLNGLTIYFGLFMAGIGAVLFTLLR